MIRVNEEIVIPNHAILQHLHNRYDKDLYRSFNDGSTIFTTWINGNLLAENTRTREAIPTYTQMFIIYDYRNETKQLDVYISNIVIVRGGIAEIFKEEAEIKDLEGFLKEKLLGLYASSLF